MPGNTSNVVACGRQEVPLGLQWFDFRHGDTEMEHPHPRTGPVLLLLALVAISSARAEELVSIRVTPQFCVEGSNVRIVVRIEPHDENRLLKIEADSANFFRSSSIQLSGARAPLEHLLLLREVPSGTYEVRATVTREDDESRSAVKMLRVVSGSESELDRQGAAPVRRR
jgi:hypothetical protein